MFGRKNSLGNRTNKTFGGYNFQSVAGAVGRIDATITHLSGSTYYDEPRDQEFFEINNVPTNSEVCIIKGDAPSGNTGPPGAHEGTGYMYVETSGTSDGSRQLSRVFVRFLEKYNAGCKNGIEVSYYYQQHSATVTDLIMQWQYLPDGANDVTGWVDIHQTSGPFTETWQNDNFNLKDDHSVTSGMIQLRYYWQMGTTGEYYQHDQAIDTLTITELYR